MRRGSKLIGAYRRLTYNCLDPALGRQLRCYIGTEMKGRAAALD